jgi:hypothetical protein
MKRENSSSLRIARSFRISRVFGVRTEATGLCSISSSSSAAWKSR